MSDETDTTTEVARVPGEVQWRRADGTTGEYAGPVDELGHGIPRPDTGPGIRRALFDLAFGYVSGFPVRDILAYVFPGSFREGPVLEATAEAQIAAPVPAERPLARSGDSGTGGGVHGALSACEDDGISMCPKMAYSNKQLQREVSSLVQQKDQWHASAVDAEAQVQRVLELAQRWDDDGQTGIARMLREAVLPEIKEGHDDH